MLPHGYLVRGEWHIGYLNNVLDQRQQRPNPDTTPMWSRNQLQTLDASYRQSNYAVPGTVWPTAAVGMTTNLPNLRHWRDQGFIFGMLITGGKFSGCGRERSGIIE